MEIAVPEGNVSVTVGCHDGKYYINAGGMEVASGKALRWLDEDGLPAGTTVEVTCCDVPEPAVPAPPPLRCPAGRFQTGHKDLKLM